jgi:protein arginine kinase
MINNPDFLNGYIIKSRVRLARNFEGYPFCITDLETANVMTEKIALTLDRIEDFTLYKMSSLKETQKEGMKERHLISNALIKNVTTGAVLINNDQTLSIMIHEEDVIREQCILNGLRLFEAYKKIDLIDNAIARSLAFAFDDKLGYLTSCPTNVGTGLRASVMMFLPALTESGKIKNVINHAYKLGLTVRGIYGEGSDSEGNVYQISNEITLGLSEYEILKRVNDTALELAEAERFEAEKLYIKNQITAMDKARKSYGVLVNAVILSYKEFLYHLSNVKLGAILGFIDISNMHELDELLISLRPAVILEKLGKNATNLDVEMKRAELTQKTLKKLMG